MDLDDMEDEVTDLSAKTWYCAVRLTGGPKVLKKTTRLHEAQAVLGKGSSSR